MSNLSNYINFHKVNEVFYKPVKKSLQSYKFVRSKSTRSLFSVVDKKNWCLIKDDDNNKKINK